MKQFIWKPERRMVTDAILILLAGLAIRVHPDFTVLSLIAWLSFIYGFVFLDEQWKNLRRWGPMAAALAYNAVFHVILFSA